MVSIHEHDRTLDYAQQTVADIIGRPDGCPIRSDKGV
jgi:hypothetical protein